MDQFAILNSRKRAIIALIHTIVFLVIAVLTSLRTVRPVVFHGHGMLGGMLMVAMYGAVTSVLSLLMAVSLCAKEKIYFALCSTSAGTALLRYIFGDAAMHGAQYLRVVLLICAVLVGWAIARGHAAVLVPQTE